MKLSSLAVNQKKSEEGVWVPVEEGCELLLARLGNPRYEAYMNKLNAPHRRALRLNRMDPAIARLNVAKAVAKHVLLGWKGLTEEDGTEIEYSEAKSLEILCDAQYVDFLDIVVELANDAQLFKEEEMEESLGN